MALNEKLLRGALLLSGAMLVVIGLNLALGGIHSMGWHIPTDFMTVTDQDLYLRHDNNVRFFGGVFTGLALMTTAGAIWPRALRPSIIAFLLAIPFGSVFRIIAPDYAIFADPVMRPSVLAELLICPALAFWLWRLR